MRSRSSDVVVLLVSLACLLAAGCPNEDETPLAVDAAGGDVDALRAQYIVELMDTVLQPDAAASPGEEVGVVASAVAASADAAAEEGGDEEMMEEGGDGPRPSNVLLTLLVRFQGEAPLPGITVDVARTDRTGSQHPSTQHWIDTSDLGNGDVQQVDLKLEDVDYEDGDSFSVLLAAPVPSERRSRYREFAESDR